MSMLPFQPDMNLHETSSLEPGESLVKVAIERGLDLEDGLTYRTTESLSLGQGVVVPVGRGNTLTDGYILEVGGEELAEGYELSKIKPIHAVTSVTMGPLQLRLCKWVAKYYACPIGLVLSAAVPKAVKKQTGRRSVQMIRLADPQPDPMPKLPPTAQSALGTLRLLDVSVFPIEKSKLKDAMHLRSIAPIHKLRDAGILVEYSEEVIRTPSVFQLLENPSDDTPPLLNTEQQQVVEGITSTLNQPTTHLIHGITGSGKTEVYMRLIEQVLRSGKTSLVLVPEIALTPQTAGRFVARFKDAGVALLHSGLSAGARNAQWSLVESGEAKVVIGPRSAIFAPIKDLGLVIVDEEHDLSFKQQDGFRYSARDLAIVRAQRSGIPLILGTATPSLETLYNSIHNRYLHLRLTQRAGDAKPPSIELISLRGAPLVDGFTGQLITEIKTELELGNQVLVFINRRGFAPTLICHECGWIAECNHCSARLTIHKHPAHLRCHHCDHQRPLASKCPSCSSSNLESLGQGTERSEAALQNVFPNTPIIRVDRDTTRRKNSLADMVSQIHQGEPCILVGTQMLAKGHHFPNVTLAALIDIDSGLFSGDFRGPERMGQLLIQVAGRAGRAQKPGRVIIQSHHCEHPNIQSLIKEGYHRYARRLLHERQVTNLPPYRHMGLLRSESKRPENAVAFLKLARQISQQKFPASQQLSYLGPLPALMERKKDRFCFQLHISSESRKMLHTVLLHLGQEMENNALARRVRWSIDVDPQDMS